MRVLGIVLLSLLLFILLVLVLLLFVPFTYRISGSCHDKKLKVHARVFALAGIVGAVFDYSDKLQFYLRLFALIKLRPFDKPDTKVTKSDVTKSEKKPKAKEPVEIKAPEIKPPEIKPPEIKPPETKPHIKDKLQNIADKICAFKNSAKSLDQKTVSFLLGKILYLLKHLSPKRSRLLLRFSAGSPDKTGQILGLLALIPFVYQKSNKIYPDFGAEEFYVETDFLLCGHIYGITILITAIQVLFDRNCQRLYKKLS